MYFIIILGAILPTVFQSSARITLAFMAENLLIEKIKTNLNFQILFTRPEMVRRKPLVFNISELYVYEKSLSIDRQTNTQILYFICIDCARVLKKYFSLRYYKIISIYYAM